MENGFLQKRELFLVKEVELIGISVAKSQRELAQMFDIGKEGRMN